MATQALLPAPALRSLSRRSFLRGLAAIPVVAAAARPASGQAAGISVATEPLAAQPAPGVELPSPEIVIADDRRLPDTVCVPVGATVTWLNAGSAWVGIAALDGRFDSGQVDPGETFAHTFTRRGCVTYVCKNHPIRDMTGRISIR